MEVGFTPFHFVLPAVTEEPKIDLREARKFNEVLAEKVIKLIKETPGTFRKGKFIWKLIADNLNKNLRENEKKFHPDLLKKRLARRTKYIKGCLEKRDEVVENPKEIIDLSQQILPFQAEPVLNHSCHSKPGTELRVLCDTIVGIAKKFQISLGKRTPWKRLAEEYSKYLLETENHTDRALTHRKLRDMLATHLHHIKKQLNSTDDVSHLEPEISKQTASIAIDPQKKRKRIDPLPLQPQHYFLQKRLKDRHDDGNELNSLPSLPADLNPVPYIPLALGSTMFDESEIYPDQFFLR